MTRNGTELSIVVTGDWDGIVDCCDMEWDGIVDCCDWETGRNCGLL